MKLISLDRRRPGGPLEGEGMPWELYNLTNDPGESNNLANQSRYTSLIEKLDFIANEQHVDDLNWPSGINCQSSDTYERTISFTLKFS